MDRRELMTASLAVALAATVARAAPAKAASAASYGLKRGAPDLKSVGPIAFGPAGLLFVADPMGAKIFALDVGAGTAAKARPIDIDKLDTRLAAFLGAAPADIFVRDMAVQPGSNTLFLSVMRGSGAAATPVLVKVGADGAFSQVSLKSIAFAQTDVEKAPDVADTRTSARVVTDSREGQPMKAGGADIRLARDPLRSVTFTDLAYVDGMLLVAGASNEEFSSSFRRVAFPFGGQAQMNSLEIYHVSHNRFETASPINTFTPYGGGKILAAYTCTPIVQFSLGDAAAGTQVKGKSVADLGTVSTPLDMVAYKAGGEDYFLVSNSSHPLMKLARSDIDKQDAMVVQTNYGGAIRANLAHKGVGLMANLGGDYVVMMHRDEANTLSLRSYAVESL